MKTFQRHRNKIPSIVIGNARLDDRAITEQQITGTEDKIGCHHLLME
jgi:hypothetical protein